MVWRAGGGGPMRRCISSTGNLYAYSYPNNNDQQGGTGASGSGASTTTGHSPIPIVRAGTPPVHGTMLLSTSPGSLHAFHSVMTPPMNSPAGGQLQAMAPFERTWGEDVVRVVCISGTRWPMGDVIDDARCPPGGVCVYMCVCVRCVHPTIVRPSTNQPNTTPPTHKHTDTHSRHDALLRTGLLPPGDILVHAGDFSTTGTRPQVENFRDFLKVGRVGVCVCMYMVRWVGVSGLGYHPSQPSDNLTSNTHPHTQTVPYAHKVVVGGNHDITLHEPYYEEHGEERFHKGG